MRSVEMVVSSGVLFVVVLIYVIALVQVWRGDVPKVGDVVVVKFDRTMVVGHRTRPVVGWYLCTVVQVHGGYFVVELDWAVGSWDVRINYPRGWRWP
jgi:hypothetical protein